MQCLSHAKILIHSSKTLQQSFAHATMTSALIKTSLFGLLDSTFAWALLLICPSLAAFSMWRFRCTEHGQRFSSVIFGALNSRGPFLESPGNFSGSQIHFFILSVRQKVYTPETSCIERTTVYYDVDKPALKS